MKKWLTSLLAALLLCLPVCGISICGLTACGKRNPPELEDIYDRLVEVIEASHEVNVLLFGAGLPVYPRGDAEDELIHRYYGVTDNGREYVTPYAKYTTVADIEAAMASVYGTKYRESLMESTFTGYADEEISYILPARFSEDEWSLYQNAYVDPLVSGVRMYDYASMEIVKAESTANRIKVSVSSYTDKTEGEWITVYLSFIYENGNWYLDSPSC